MHSSTNAILKKNQLKQPRREDEVVLSIPLLELHTAGSAGTFWVVPGCHLGGFLAVGTRLCSCVLPYIQTAPVTTGARGFVLLSRLCLSSVPGCKPVGLHVGAVGRVPRVGGLSPYSTATGCLRAWGLC